MDPSEGVPLPFTSLGETTKENREDPLDYRYLPVTPKGKQPASGRAASHKFVRGGGDKNRKYETLTSASSGAGEVLGSVKAPSRKVWKEK